ncbi:MAG: UvrD-helicase domain-containing protein [Deltaproteobacteria bacterium]|nr:UvrD-helicase domain-containing protein [Deltaproteobacteria bacterium]
MDLSHLNPPQAEAVRTTEGPLLVLAGAGSGKTRVIAHRVAYLLAVRKVPATQILAVTFTNKAAAEMRERISKLAKGLAKTKGLTVCTFHAFGLEVLKESGRELGLPKRFAIADSGDQLSVIKRAMRDAHVDDRKFDPRKVQALISKAKCAGITPQPKAEGLGDDYDLITAMVFPRYEQSLRAQAMVDFDDLIILPERLFREHEGVRAQYIDRYRYMLVDEYQDTSKSQLDLLRHLSGARRNLCVVGDDDQSIYSWRGAEVDNILGFDRHFPGAKEVYLEQNYRSTRNVLACANGVIAGNVARKAKKLWCDRHGGDPVQVVACPEDDEEARFISREIEQALKNGRRPSEIAVLYRTSAQSKPVEESLQGMQIPYAVSGGPEFFDRREVKDVLAYLKACVNPDDELSVLRVINVPPRGIGEVSVERLHKHAVAQGTQLWAALKDAEAVDLPPGAAAKVQEFCALVERYRARFDAATVDGVARELVEEVGLRDEIRRTAASLEAANKRLAALDQLLDSIERHAQNGRRDLLSYLRAMSLDSREEADPGEAVTLSTLHASKGLEWPLVFLCGVEEEILPHKGMQGEAQNLDEERRLAYVGITRAREKLWMTWCKQRLFRNKLIPRTPSRFLQDLPKDAIEEHDLTAPPKDASPDRETNFLAELRAKLRAQSQSGSS